MANTKVSRQDQSKSSSSTSKVTTKLSPPTTPPQTPAHISTKANHTLFDNFTKAAITIAMDLWHLLAGMTIAVSASLWAIIRKIYIPTPKPKIRYRAPPKTKGPKSKKSKVLPTPIAPPKIEFVEPAIAHSVQTPSGQTTPSSPALEGRKVIQTLKDVASLVTPAMFKGTLSAHTSSAQTPNVQTAPPTPSSASRDCKVIQHPEHATPLEDAYIKSPNTPLTGTSSAQTKLTPPTPSPGSGNNLLKHNPLPTLLSDAQLLFKMAKSDDSEDAVSSQPPPARKKPSNLTVSSQITLSAALDRLEACMSTRLRIAPGSTRAATLLALVWDMHFATSPDISLPLRGSAENRKLNAREIACLFLNRYALAFWPPLPQPAPHLLDRSLQFPRDVTLEPARYGEWEKLLMNPPAKGTPGNLANSRLALAMTEFVKLVYELPVKKSVGVDWGAVALVLDDVKVDEGNLGGRFEGLPAELKRQVMRLD